MTWYAIKDGENLGRCVMQESPPEEPHVVIEPWLGLPRGGGPGYRLRESGGRLYWAAVDSDEAWEAVRAERERLLAKCDWTQGRDIPEWRAALWAPYRQALRDITKQADPFNIEWPVKPE